MIDRLVLLGATGDLAGRFLLPALAVLHDTGRLPATFDVVGGATKDGDDETFRRHAAARLDEHAGDVPVASRQALVASLHYRPVDLTDEASMAALIGSDRPVAVYLALPPALFDPTVQVVGALGLPPGSRVVLEKPFGGDQASARDLNTLLHNATASAGPTAGYRVDHVRGMATVENLVELRRSDPVITEVWDAAHLERVEVLWEETLALEDRAGYYDTAGALLDVVQNHVLQILSLVAMEPPGPDDGDVHDRQVEVVRALRLAGGDVASSTRRARYTAGTLADSGGADGRAVPDYAQESGVDPERETETFAELRLEVDTPRWAGTTFVLRAGKALRRRRKGVLALFRPRPGSPRDGSAIASPLWIGIDGPDDLRLDLAGREPAVSPPPEGLPAYANVLLDVLQGGSRLSVRGDVAEEAWRVVDPVVEGWRSGVVPLEEYSAGSDGPTHT